MKLCSKFHSSRVTDLRQLWKELSVSLKLDNLIKDPLFLEYINETLMTEHVKKSFEAVVQTVEVPELNDAELNALRYSAGYVPWKLKQKFSKRKDPYCKEYLTCLDRMRESSAEKDVNDCVSYMEYTKRWIQLVDRGGLFHISDEVYSFFYEVECLVRKFLFEIVQDTREHSKDEIIDEVACDGGVQFHWSTIAADLDEDASKALLVEVVKLWLTIRGFSTAGAFVEQYKQTVKKSTKIYVKD